MDETGIEYSRELSGPHPEVLDGVKLALSAGGWGVMSDIDVRKVMKEKRGAEMESYNILDVCNPRFAERALSLNRRAGLVLPCKMIVYSEGPGTKVSLYLPTKMLPKELGGRKELTDLAEEAEGSLKKVIDGLPGGRRTG